MNAKQIECLDKALDEILNMSEEELFKDFGKPEAKYYFSELASLESSPEFCNNSPDPNTED